MVQGGDRAGLAFKPLLQIGISGDMLGEDFDRHGAVQAGVGAL